MREGRSRGGTLAGRGRGRLLRIRERVFLQRAVAVGQGSERRRGRVRAHRGDGSLGHGRFGDSAEEARQESPGGGVRRPLWVGSAQCVKLLAAKLAHTGELLFARRAVESHGLGVIR